MTEGAVVLSAQGVILYCNCGFSRMVEAPAEELVGIPFMRLAAEEDRQLFQDLLEKSANGQTCAGVVRLSGSGTTRAVRLSAGVRIAGSDSDAVFCVVVDDAAPHIQTEDALRQTKRRLERTAEMLRESQAKYLDLYEHADDIMFALDSLGRFTSANRSFYAGLGFEEDVAGKHFLEVFASESARTVFRIMDKLLVNEPHAREKQPWEFEMAAADGSIVNFEIRARLVRAKETIVGLQCIARNITGHKQVEMELNRLAAAIEQAAESVIILDRNGKIQYANKAFFRISGYSREEVLGRTTAFLKSDKRGHETFYRGMASAVGAKSVWTGRISNRKKDGWIYEVETTISPVRDKAGKVVNYVAVERDVAEEVRLESQLRQMQKMEAIGTLAGGVAHDFNNILSAIIGFSEMSLEDIDEGHPAKHYAAQILRAASRGKDLVRRIMAFSHRNDAERKQVRLDLIIREALKLLRASLPTTIEILERIETESCVIFASSTQIHQVIMNLCTNAGHAMRAKGGVLEVSLAGFEVDSANEAPHFGMEPGPYVKISVSDTGEGMTREILDRIFAPFFTTKSPSEGTGMGLAVVHGIVKSHGGAITVKSAPGKGAVFDVYFPRVDASDAAEAEAAVYSRMGTGRILLVDDEDAIVEMGASALERLGYEVRATRDSLEALEIFRRDPASFDLVITDQTMPHMTGTELAKELAGLRSDIPIILCTGYSEIVDLDRAKELGIRALLTKPVSRSELSEGIRRALEETEQA
jgi:PAS domain S-box-containing protein